jgi:hypothetical protein
VDNRVTKQGELSPNGRLFTLDKLFKLYLKVTLLLAYFFHCKKYLCITFDKKWVGLQFWGIFSQSNLVTLVDIFGKMHAWLS